MKLKGMIKRDVQDPLSKIIRRTPSRPRQAEGWGGGGGEGQAQLDNAAHIVWLENVRQFVLAPLIITYTKGKRAGLFQL